MDVFGAPPWTNSGAVVYAVNIYPIPLLQHPLLEDACELIIASTFRQELPQHQLWYQLIQVKNADYIVNLTF